MWACPIPQKGRLTGCAQRGTRTQVSEGPHILSLAPRVLSSLSKPQAQGLLRALGISCPPEKSVQRVFGEAALTQALRTGCSPLAPSVLTVHEPSTDSETQRFTEMLLYFGHTDEGFGPSPQNGLCIYTYNLRRLVDPS